MALTIRGTEEIMPSLKQLTGQKTAAGALVEAAKIGVKATAELNAAKARVAHLESTVETYKQAIASLEKACKRVAEIAAQEDLFGKSEP